MKKRYLPLAILATAALSLTACSAGTTGGSGSDATGQTLDVWIMQGTNTESDEFFERVGDEFTKETGAKLNVEMVQWADAHDRFVTAIAGGTTPDIAETGTTWTAEFAESGALAPIDDYVTEAGLDGKLVEGLVEAGTLDDTLYGMPWYAGVRSVIYRTDLFEAAGIAVPTTWAEFQDAVLSLKASNPDIIPFPVAGDAEQLTYPWVWGAGGEVATKKGDTWTSGLDSAKSQAGIQFYTDLALKHGASTAGATTWKETDILDNFAQGKVGMAVMGSWTPATILDKNPELEGKIGSFPIPGQTSGISPSMLGGSHLSMFESSENKDLAWEFMNMMTTGEFATEWATQSGYFPGETTALDASVASADEITQAFATQMVDGGASLPVTPKFGAVQAKKTTNTMIQSILSGEKTVEQATADAAAEMTDILNEK
ncbi:sugar ABC transporter substrate-binding protein [Leifsonia sp. Root4]|uniref:sugar ABC transporter substrate-binding protein n=1 Tax=Leifsonia sp. Root4 TaxID=1736525 RepID=UPI0006F393A1|nr:sugar ABC transporter substrate-binding protein [Leifsonia sp. Root4]KQW07970.1 sugar ABC transporter substrate-binding protein [Leifsonia sp. Root4]